MSFSPKQFADCASVGEPSQKAMSGVESIKFVIHDFAKRKEEKGQGIDSPILKAHSYDWRIRVFPRGDNEAKDDHITCWLELREHSSITVMFSIRCTGGYWSDSKPELISFTQRWCVDFCTRDFALLNCLENDGSIGIEFNIQIAVENKRVWYPKELEGPGGWIDLEQDTADKSSDVVFCVGENRYPAQRNALSLLAEKLYEIAEDCEGDVPIPIPSVQGDVFKTLLDFVHTLKTPNIEDGQMAAGILVAADRYSCVHLKLYAESVLVDKFLTATNAASLLILADSHSCALLKEAATKLIVVNPDLVKETDAWSQVLESNKLLQEIIDACFKRVSGESLPRKMHEMDVDTLRNKLEDVNLDPDGSREVLVERLKTSHQG